MMLQQLLLHVILSLILIRKQIICAENSSENKNVAVLYNFPLENETKNEQTISNATNKPEVLNNSVYQCNNMKNYKQEKQISSVNMAYLYNFTTALAGNNTFNTVKRNQTKSKLNSNNLYAFNLTKGSHSGQQNGNKLLSQNKITTNSSLFTNNIIVRTNISTVGSLAELYFFSTPTVMGMFNCSYENTINITDYTSLPNGSYIYDNQTIIPTDLVGNYNYEILYDGTKRLVAQHKRACICHLKQCITLCSNSIIEFYRDVVNDGEDDDFMNLFTIKTTLTNKTVVTKNIANDFAHIVLDEFCVPFYTLSPEKDEKLGWTLFENGSLLRHSDQVQLKRTEYCFELYQDEFRNETYYFINPLNCAKKRDDLRLIEEFNYWSFVYQNIIISNISAQILSIPFFVLTIIAYCCLPELRNVHGKCFMTYLSTLTISYGLLSYINLSQSTFDPMPCLLMGYLNHYMQLSHYTWLAIICIDTWKSFSDYAYKASYYKYAMYGYHLPLLMTFLTFLAQHSKIDENLKPGISEYRCGLEVNKWAASIYLFGPCLIILLFCLISFILTSRIIKRNDREVYKVNEMKFECPKARYALYLRLFLMMGLSWFLDVISYLLNMFNMRNLSGIIDYINALQGLYIFVNFIGRRRVRNVIKDRLNEGRRFNLLM